MPEAKNNKLHIKFNHKLNLHKYGMTLRIFLPGVFYTTPRPPGATEDIDLTAYPDTD